nr:transmembrane protein 249 [Chelonoidis abingdonii]
MLRGAFMLWNLCFFDVERSLARRLQQNTHYPFQVQQPNVFVMEYYKDTLWKGALVFLICVLGGVFYFKSEKLLPQPGSQDQQVSLAPAPSPPCSSLALGLGSRVRPLQVSQDYFGFFVYGTLVGFWLLLSSMHKRHLVINHVQGCYQIYIKRRLWEEGPLHQIYVRLTAQTDAYGKCFYSLIINGHGLEVLALASLSDKYEVSSLAWPCPSLPAWQGAMPGTTLQPTCCAWHTSPLQSPCLASCPPPCLLPRQHMEFLGRRIARRLKLNYFDYLDVSTRHVIRHRPPLERDEELQV